MKYARYTMKVVEVSSNTYHFVIDSVNKSGKKQHQELTESFDGNARPSEVNPRISELSEHPNASTWKTTDYSDGRIVGELTGIVSQDAKTMTATSKRVTPDGNPIQEVYFYEPEGGR
jgi:histidinol dehydrogenase